MESIVDKEEGKVRKGEKIRKKMNFNESIFENKGKKKIIFLNGYSFHLQF